MNTQILITLFSASIICGCKTTKIVSKSQEYLPVDKSLYETILTQDSILFSAFNSRNLEKLKSCFTDSLIVHQDNIGVRNYNQTIESFKGLFEKDYVLKRQLIKESVEVHPIKNYGAIQTGRHTFCHTENGKFECATYKFVEIWENKNGQWKIAQIITYDHKL